MIRAVFLISAILNAVLVATVVGTIPLMLFLVVVFCGGLVWYIRKLLSQMHEVERELHETIEVFDSFVTHLDSIYKLEMFYGDDTLQGLLDHSQGVLKHLDQFAIKYFPDTEMESSDTEMESYDETEEE